MDNNVCWWICLILTLNLNSCVATMNSKDQVKELREIKLDLEKIK